ncbi:MAG: hypothetical protein ACI35O_14455 [Bacillaceae bacterium]
MIIFDEKKHAEELLKKGFKSSHKQINDLKILGKYYFAKELNEDKVKKKLIEFAEEHIPQFNINEWYKIINNTVYSAKNGKFITGKIVEITESELETIQQLAKLNEQKVAFVMLVLYKFYDHRKFEINIEELYRLCKVTSINSQTKLKILQNLTSKGLIDINMKGERWVTFVNNDSQVKVKIIDFDDFIFEYLYLLCEDEFLKCDTCQKVVKKTSNSRKYCKSCFQLHKKERKKEVNKRYYNKNKIKTK